MAPETPVLTITGKVHRDVEVVIQDLARRVRTQADQIAKLTPPKPSAANVTVVQAGGSSGGGSAVAAASQVTLGLPVPPGDARQYLDGAAIPAYKRVEDFDLLLHDTTVNDVSDTKHGFAPKGGEDVFDEVFLLMGC